MSDTYERGMKVRRAVLGDAHVDRATANASELTRDFQDLITRYAWGEIWTRPGLDLKTRTLVTVVSDASTGREPELAIHLRMALRQGWTEEELTEVLLHLMGYVGAPLVRARPPVEERRRGEQHRTDAHADHRHPRDVGGRRQPQPGPPGIQR